LARLMLVEDKTKARARQGNASLGHRGGAATEGEAAKRLLEANGFMPRRVQPQNGQYEHPCPFHEEPGTLQRGRATNFYLDAKSSQYYCQSASCGEKGNLQTLEHFFGIQSDPNLYSQYKNKDIILQQYQGHLTIDRREVFYAKGLRDEEIERFRLGFDPLQDCYVIPYLESRRPVAFRFYDPTVRGEDEKGKPVYGGPNGSKYWWERADGYGDRPGSISNTDDGVLRLFNPSAATGDEKGRVYICEGELKAMLLARNGLSAVSIPGVRGFKREWAQYFMHAKEVIVVMDNDNPDFHQHAPCHKCGTTEKQDCQGHNPGQEGAARLVEFFGHRAKNVVLPLPDGERKTDINEYIMRDHGSFNQFIDIVEGRFGKASPYVFQTLAEIRQEPPDETVFLVSGGLLPRGGRLLVTGPPKGGKSIFVENLALSIASGIPFLHRFDIANDGSTPGHRVLLLDRELSKRSLFDRLNILIDHRPGFAVADDKLIIDHSHRLLLDQEGASQELVNIIEANQAEVLILDTAYKFFTGDMESAKSVSKAVATLDYAIQETGVSVILTHHHRKGGTDGARAQAPSSDQVMGSVLWTGWSSGTVLLNFKDRSVKNPFTTIASFVAFRDAAPPEPLLLKRSKESIAYSAIEDFSYEDLEETEKSGGYGRPSMQRVPLNYDNVANALLEAVPIIEDEFLHAASARFGCKPDTVKIHLLDILDRHPDFKRVGKGARGDPYTWKYKFDKDETSYEEAEERGENNVPIQLQGFVS
jgi:hypothetical protein